MNDKPVQYYYPEDYNYCYGCGRLNEHGMHFESYWDGSECVCVFEPKPYHTAFPGYVYGGLIASMIDCHSLGTAAAVMYGERGSDYGSGTAIRFVTASLHVDYLKPTPIGVPLEVRSRAAEIKGRKIVVKSELTAAGEVCARGEVVAVQIPEGLAR